MKTQIGNYDVDVMGERLDIVLESSLFKNWKRSLDKKLVVQSIRIQSVDTVMRKGKEEILFLKLKAEIKNEFGKFIPGIVFLRGAAVGILIVLETEKEKHAVLIQSAQAAIGSASYPQLPAGMMDRETDAQKVAEREMEEETGIKPNEGIMTDLTREFYGESWKGVFPSPGACDEAVKLFLFRKKVTEDELKKIQGRKTGIASEHEYITLRLVNLDKLCKMTPDVKAHSAYMMYQALNLGESHD